MSHRIFAAGTCALIVVLLFTPSAQSAALEMMETVCDRAVHTLLPPLWLFEHGKSFTLDRFNPTCPQCI
jgi:hypothetical protein